MSDTIICPQCHFEIEVTEVLSAQLRLQLQREFEADNRRKEAALAEREQEVALAKEQIAKAEQDFDHHLANELERQRAHLAAEALETARGQVSVELADRDQQLAEVHTKLKTAQESELALRKERRDLEEQKHTLELTLTRRLDEERDKIRETAKREAADERLLKDAEKDKLIGDLTRQIDELKRKSEQGSQQLQGEVLELSLENVLRRHFPLDTFIPVPKGIHGGDVLQEVHESGRLCATILWEAKRTKTWSDGWLPKLRDDQRAAKAQVAILVTVELPKDVSHFSQVDGVWIASWQCALGLASAIRHGLIEVSIAKQALDGQHGKMELLYKYLSGSEFRHRIEGIVEAFITLKDDLETEKRAMQRIWARREKQLERAVAQTAAMHGDLSGIIGAQLPAIEALMLPRIATDADLTLE
jgi:hypothetical protein